MAVDIIVGKAPDKAILALFAKLEDVFGRQHRSFNISGVSVADPPEELLAKRDTSRAIASAQYHPQGAPFVLNFQRNHQGSPYYDLVQITPQQNGAVHATAEMMLQLQGVIAECLKIPDQPPTLSKHAQGIVEKEIAALADMHRIFLDDAQQLRVRYEEEEIARRSRFEGEVAAERERLAQHERETLRALSSKQSELDDKITQFDLSDHMRARRKQREEITTQIQGFLQEPSKTKASVANQYMIMFVCMFGFFLAGWFAYESFQSFISRSQQNLSGKSLSELTAAMQVGSTASAPPAELQTVIDEMKRAIGQTNTPDYMLWLLALRGAVLSAVAIGFIVYLLSFLRRNHDEDVRYHRELQRYGMDINRASWVIETAMEMTSKENAALPEAWVHGACSGLFQAGREKENEVNSLSALGAVMGLGPDVEVSPTGARLSFSGKAARAAAKDAQG